MDRARVGDLAFRTEIPLHELSVRSPGEDPVTAALEACRRQPAVLPVQAPPTGRVPEHPEPRVAMPFLAGLGGELGDEFGDELGGEVDGGLGEALDDGGPNVRMLSKNLDDGGPNVRVLPQPLPAVSVEESAEGEGEVKEESVDAASADGVTGDDVASEQETVR